MRAHTLCIHTHAHVMGISERIICTHLPKTLNWGLRACHYSSVTSCLLDIECVHCTNVSYVIDPAAYW